MVLVSVNSTEIGNGYDWNNDFAEALVVEPNARVSLINVLFERDGDYIVKVGSNAFRIKMGGRENPDETVAVLPGTYNAWDLADAIQEAMNEKGLSRGHSFNVNYNKNDKQFEISTLYHMGKIPLTAPAWVDASTSPTGADPGPNITYTQATNTLDWSKSGDGSTTDDVDTFDTQWAITKGFIESQNVPSTSNGGSRFQATMLGQLGVPTTDTSREIVMGLYSGVQEPVPVEGRAWNIDSAVYSAFDSAFVFKRNLAGHQTLQIVENGADIGLQNPDGTAYSHPLVADTIYSIVLDSSHTTLGYYYQRSGSKIWHKLPVKNQQITLEELRGRQLRGLIGANNGTYGGWKDISIAYAGTRNLVGQDLDASLIIGHTLEIDDKVDGKYALTRTLNATDDVVNKGWVSQLIQQGEYSDLDFQIKATQSGVYYVSLLDESKRDANNADTTNFISTGDIRGGNANGSTANGGDTPTALPNFNPAVITLRFDSDNGLVYYRREQNTQLESSDYSVIYEPITIPTSLPEWSAWGANQKWVLKTVGHMGIVELHANPDAKDASGVAYSSAKVLSWDTPIVGFSGVGTVSLSNAGAGYVALQTYAFTVTGGTGQSFQGQIKTDGAGALILTDFDIDYNGYGYTVGDVLTLVIASTNPGVVGTLTIDALYSSNQCSAMGLEDVAPRTGYRYHLLSEGWVGDATATQPSIQNIELLRVNQSEAGQGGVPENYVEFKPNYETEFGDLIGYKNEIYYMSGEHEGHSNKLVSDAPPIPDASSIHHPIVHININNLPLRSLVGQKFNKLSTLAGGPVGSRNGVTRLLAQVPRYHEKNGSSGVERFGPFYYNYFPYDIPLHNATNINLNELDVTLTNTDGTLATDISDCKLLLNITNEENVGGYSDGSIGHPRERKQTQEQRDVLKSQMIPLKS